MIAKNITLNGWKDEKKRLRGKLIDLLGGFPEPIESARAKVKGTNVETIDKGGYFLEKLILETELGTQIPAFFARPKNVKLPAPTIVYLHCHGHQYDQGKIEITEGKICKRLMVYGTGEVKEGVENSTLLYTTYDEYIRVAPCAADLTAKGYNVLALDSICFEERRENEETLFQNLMWKGKTLWGKMIWDEIRGIDYLFSRKDVDVNRIGCMGMSMGAVKSWWLAAIDERIKTSVAICFLSTYKSILDHKVMNLHRPIIWVPGLLNYMDAGEIISMIAPRPFLSINGTKDDGCPLDGLDEVHEIAGRIYSLFNAREKLHKELHDSGHQFLPEMRKQAYEWLDRWLLA